MSYKLTYTKFRWCSENEITELFNNITKLPNDSDVGYTLQVDLKYSNELHDSFI